MENALKALQSGEPVAMPTDTVYGLLADATNRTAIEKLYDLKARPTGRPFQVLVNSMEMAESLAQFDDAALKLAKKFWPGPLTLVLPVKANEIVDYAVCGNLGNLYTIGLRWPKHKALGELIDQLGKPIAASSVNRTGEMPLNDPAQIHEEFPHIRIVEGKADQTPSTIVELKDGELIMYREGDITEERLRRAIES